MVIDFFLTLIFCGHFRRNSRNLNQIRDRWMDIGCSCNLLSSNEIEILMIGRKPEQNLSYKKNPLAVRAQKELRGFLLRFQ